MYLSQSLFRQGPHLTWKSHFQQQVGWGTRLVTFASEFVQLIVYRHNIPMGEENCVWQLPEQQAWPSAGRHAVTTTLHWETKRVFRTEVEKTQCNKHYLEHRCLTVQQTVSSSLNSSLTFGMSSWPSGQQCLRESASKKLSKYIIFSTHTSWTFLGQHDWLFPNYLDALSSLWRK